MLTTIRGLRGQRQLRAEVLRQLSGLLERRRVAPVSMRVAFCDDDGPRGGVATRCALFRVWLGEVVEETREAIILDKSGWRKKHLVGPSHAGVSKRRGVHRDRFAHRVEAQHGRFAVDLARRVQRWSERHRLLPVRAGERPETTFARPASTAGTLPAQLSIHPSHGERLIKVAAHDYHDVCEV
jgi:hypothetical protein